MAISDMKGTVTTTGMMNNKPATMKAPDMSKIKMPTARKPASVKEVAKPVEQPKEMTLAEKVQNLTDQDRAVLATVLSPSVSNVLKKIAPDLSPLLDQAGPSEENVIIPVSMFKNFSQKRYSGDETQAVQSLITDMSVTEMGQSTVPPDTEMADLPESGIEQELNTIDTGGEVI